MEQPPASYDWLATLLELLFERVDAASARALLRDEQTRRQTLVALEPELIAAGTTAVLLASPEGDNLLMAVLALRVKFSPAEAREKVRLNIALRGGR